MILRDWTGGCQRRGFVGGWTAWVGKSVLSFGERISKDRENGA